MPVRSLAHACQIVVRRCHLSTYTLIEAQRQRLQKRELLLEDAFGRGLEIAL